MESNELTPIFIFGGFFILIVFYVIARFSYIFMKSWQRQKELDKITEDQYFYKVRRNTPGAKIAFTFENYTVYKYEHKTQKTIVIDELYIEDGGTKSQKIKRQFIKDNYEYVPQKEENYSSDHFFFFD